MIWKLVAVNFLFLVSIILVGWAVKIFDVKFIDDTTNTVLYSDIDFLRHSENKTWISWLFESGVCELGRSLGIAYFIFAITAMCVYSFSSNRERNGKIIAILSIIIIIIAGIMAFYLNRPLAIRLLPAAVTICFAIVILLK